MPAPAPLLPKPLPIAIIPQDGFNLHIEEQLDPYNVIVKLASPAHNWFAGTFTNLPNDKEVTIGLSMEGNATKGNQGNVKKWEGLHPVFTYANPTKYESYEWFQKDTQGRWVSGDPFRRGEAKFAGTGKVPDQQVIPKELAEQFLSDDGKYWQAWREVDEAVAVANLNIFRCTQKFALPEATIAMRVPFTYTYLQQFVTRLQAAKLPGVFVDDIGLTPEKRKIQIIRVEDSNSVSKPLIKTYKRPNGEIINQVILEEADASTNAKTKPRVMLLTAREHATEHSSSWNVVGVLNYLLSNAPASIEARTNTSWLLVCILDPDGSANSTFDNLTDEFNYKPNDEKWQSGAPDEVFAYIRYLRAFINSGREMVASVSFHNLECGEGPCVVLPFTTFQYKAETSKFTSLFFHALSDSHIPTGPLEPWDVGCMSFRLYGWCGLRYGAFSLAYETNDRNPARRLSIQEIETIGGIFTHSLVDFFKTPDGQYLSTRRHEFLANRKRQADTFLRSGEWPPEDPSPFAILGLGY